MKSSCNEKNVILDWPPHPLRKQQAAESQAGRQWLPCSLWFDPAGDPTHKLPVSGWTLDHWTGPSVHHDWKHSGQILAPKNLCESNTVLVVRTQIRHVILFWGQTQAQVCSTSADTSVFFASRVLWSHLLIIKAWIKFQFGQFYCNKGFSCKRARSFQILQLPAVTCTDKKIQWKWVKREDKRHLNKVYLSCGLYFPELPLER